MIQTDGLPAPQRRLVMFCILCGVALSNIDSAIANIALPTIARELAGSASAAVWVVNGYQLAVAVSLLPIAALGEILAPKRVYAFGLIAFGLASLACALSPTLGWLVGARLAQGIAGSCVAGLGPALIRLIYPRAMLSKGLAMLAIVVAISAVVGPTIAAMILYVARWPWLFLVNLPVCLVAAPLFIAVAPRGSRHSRPFDVSGAILNAIALGLIVTSVDALGREPKIAIAEAIVGVAALALLIMVQRKREAPLLPLDLLRLPIFSLSICASVCSYAAQILAYVSLPFLFQVVMHRSTLASGFLVTPWPLMVAFAAPLSGRLLSRYSASGLSSVGLCILLLGLALMAALPAQPADWDIVWRMAVCGVGFGFFQTPNNTVLMSAGPPERAASASGMVAVARTIGWAFGSALVALVFAFGGTQATRACLAIGAAFAAAGALASGARLLRGSSARAS